MTVYRAFFCIFRRDDHPNTTGNNFPGAGGEVVETFSECATMFDSKYNKSVPLERRERHTNSAFRVAYLRPLRERLPHSGCAFKRNTVCCANLGVATAILTQTNPVPYYYY